MLSRFTQLIGLGSAVAIAVQTPQAQAQSETPLLIPFNTSFSHSDNHWIAWMPTHPLYEAVEVRSHPDAQSPKGVSVQVFFTERAGGKNQVHYFNTDAAAKAFRGTAALYRDIAYTAAGAKGSPQNLDVTFKDKDDRPVEISMEFGPKQPMSDLHAGLTNQMGHNRNVLFLLFFREMAASAAQNRILIDGQDFSINAERATSEEQLSRTGYRSNAFVFTIPFGKSQYTWKDGVLANSWRRTFNAVSRPGGERVFRSEAPDGTRIEAVTTSSGDVREYRHLNGAHTVLWSFQPALPSILSAQHGQRIRYEASIDNFGVQVHGTAVVQKSNDRLVIEWQHESPEWTRGYRFQSIVQSTPAGYDLEVTNAWIVPTLVGTRLYVRDRKSIVAVELR